MLSRSTVALGVIFVIITEDTFAAQSPRVSFSAGLDKNAELKGNTTIVWDKVLTNYGSGYNSQTGVFTANVAGAYVFQFHGLTENDGSIWLELFVNDVYKISAYSHSVNDYGAASNAIVLSLHAGDTVSVRGDGNIYLYGQPDEIYGTFNGFLLYAAHGH